MSTGPHGSPVQCGGGGAAGGRGIKGDAGCCGGGLEVGVASTGGVGGRDSRRCGWGEGVGGRLGCAGALGITVLLDLDGDGACMKACVAVGGRPEAWPVEPGPALGGKDSHTR